MKTTRNRIAILLCAALLVMLLAGCQSSQSLTFKIENGDIIKVTLDTSDGYNLSQEDGVFTVQKDGEDLLNGIFLTAEGYDAKANAVLTSPDATILEASPEDSPTKFLYQFEGDAGTETDLLFKVDGAETGVIIGSLYSLEEIEGVFKQLTFENVIVEKK